MKKLVFFFFGAYLFQMLKHMAGSLLQPFMNIFFINHWPARGRRTN